jgi:DNA-binding transcriptional regulator YbjK
LTPATRRRPRRADGPPRGEARRAAILEATLRVIGDEGPGAVTHRRVASEAGLPLASTTYWFASKDELLAEACRLFCERDLARLEEVAATLRDDPGRDLAEALTDLLVGELVEGRATLLAFYALWLEAARRPALRDVAQEYAERYRLAVRDLLAGAGSASPDVDARVLVAVIDGLVADQLAGGPADPAAELRPALARVVTALLG